MKQQIIVVILLLVVIFMLFERKKSDANFYWECVTHEDGDEIVTVTRTANYPHP